jgi:uncharacterized membrane protein YoaK (UPF0700 family)
MSSEPVAKKPASPVEPVLPRVLLGLTVVTGIVDAVSFLALGRVFTANMTGNVVLLGFAVAGAAELSVTRSVAALLAFLVGAAVGGRLAASSAPRRHSVAGACAAEAFLLAVAAVLTVGAGTDLVEAPVPLYAAIAFTGVAMGIRNATVRKLAVPDMTTTVLTLTLTGLAADSSLAGGSNPGWKRRIASVLALFAGAALGAWMVRSSVALPLAVSAAASAACAAAAWIGMKASEA